MVYFIGKAETKIFTLGQMRRYFRFQINLKVMQMHPLDLKKTGNLVQVIFSS